MTNNYNAKKALHTFNRPEKKELSVQEEGFGVSFTIVSAKLIKNITNISLFSLMSSLDTW